MLNWSLNMNKTWTWRDMKKSWNRNLNWRLIKYCSVDPCTLGGINQVAVISMEIEIFPCFSFPPSFWPSKLWNLRVAKLFFAEIPGRVDNVKWEWWNPCPLGCLFRDEQWTTHHNTWRWSISLIVSPSYLFSRFIANLFSSRAEYAASYHFYSDRTQKLKSLQIEMMVACSQFSILSLDREGEIVCDMERASSQWSYLARAPIPPFLPSSSPQLSFPVQRAPIVIWQASEMEESVEEMSKYTEYVHIA